MDKFEFDGSYPTLSAKNAEKGGATRAEKDGATAIPQEAYPSRTGKANAGPSTRFGAFHAPKLAQDDRVSLLRPSAAEH
jgi:hypothetical protein